MLLRFFVPISGAGYPGQRKFYTVMYYISCMWAWLGVISELAKINRPFVTINGRLQ